MTKVIRLKGIYVELAKELSVGGLTYSALLAALGSPAGVYDFLCTIDNLVDNRSMDLPAQGVVDRFIDNHPHLQQNGDEGDIWDDQPIVCDGDFELFGGELWYDGMSHTHGGGVPVKRIVKTWDVIEWMRCEDFAYYTGAYNV